MEGANAWFSKRGMCAWSEGWVRVRGARTTEDRTQWEEKRWDSGRCDGRWTAGRARGRASTSYRVCACPGAIACAEGDAGTGDKDMYTAGVVAHWEYCGRVIDEYGSKSTRHTWEH